MLVTLPFDSHYHLLTAPRTSLNCHSCPDFSVDYEGSVRYEPNELPDCSTPHSHSNAGFMARQTPASSFRRHRWPRQDKLLQNRSLGRTALTRGAWIAWR